MSNGWGGVLEKRRCQKPGCERDFRVLPTSDEWFCCETHQPDFTWEKETCWSRGVLRAGKDFAKDPDKV